MARFGRQAALRLTARRNVAIVFFGKTKHLVAFHITHNGDDGIVGTIEAIVERRDVVESSLLDMSDIGADSAPAVRMDTIAERAKMQPHVAVGTIKVAIVVLLGNHRLLDSEAARRQVEVAHTVALQHESRFQKASRHSKVILSEIVVSASIRIPPDHGDDLIVVRYIGRAAKH